MEKPAELLQYLQKYAAPSVAVPLSNELLVKDKIVRQVNDEPVFRAVEGETKRFPW